MPENAIPSESFFMDGHVTFVISDVVLGVLNNEELSDEDRHEVPRDPGVSNHYMHRQLVHEDDSYDYDVWPWAGAKESACLRIDGVDQYLTIHEYISFEDDFDILEVIEGEGGEIRFDFGGALLDNDLSNVNLIMENGIVKISAPRIVDRDVFEELVVVVTPVGTASERIDIPEEALQTPRSLMMESDGVDYLVDFYTQRVEG